MPDPKTLILKVFKRQEDIHFCNPYNFVEILWINLLWYNPSSTLAKSIRDTSLTIKAEGQTRYRRFSSVVMIVIKGRH